MRRCLLIVNPVAGKKAALKNLDVIKQLFLEHGYVCTTVVTRYHGDAVRIAAEQAEGMDMVVCAGGDGTLNEVARGLHEAHNDCALGYIPSGSTNDFASSLSLPTKPKQAVEHIVSGCVRALDMGEFNGRVFTYIAACGAFTRTSYAAPQKRKNRWGRLAYIWEGVKEAPFIRPIHLSAEIDGEAVDGEFIWASVSNSRSVGGVIKLNEKTAVLDDGKLDVMLIRKPGNLARILQALVTGKYDIPEIFFRSAKSVRFTADQTLTWTLDGEPVESEGSVTVSCLPGELHLAV